MLPDEALKALIAAKYCDGDESGIVTLTVTELTHGLIDILSSRAMLRVVMDMMMKMAEE